jgi:hypothetical protein
MKPLPKLRNEKFTRKDRPTAYGGQAAASPVMKGEEPQPATSPDDETMSRNR